MSMSNQHHQKPPPGCHDADSAAELLGISKRALLKELRELGWIFATEPHKNLPHGHLIRCGWMDTQDRDYPLKGCPQIIKPYKVMLLTATGFANLQKALAAKAAGEPLPEPPKAIRSPLAPAPADDAQEPTGPTDKAAATRERDIAVRQLKSWGMM